MGHKILRAVDTSTNVCKYFVIEERNRICQATNHVWKENIKINNETEFKFSPEIDIIENLGNEKIVYMKKDNHQLSAKISSGTEIGNSFSFDLQNIFIFNENGKRIKS